VPSECPLRIIHCRTVAAARILAHNLASEFPGALTTRTGVTIRTELTRADLAAAALVLS
jgi:hypothetical protein